MTVIYRAPAWPVVETLLREERPVRSSRSLFGGERFVSSAGPARRLVQVSVSALAGRRDGAGLSYSLARLLDGGVNLVRLDAPPVNWFRDQPAAPHDLAGAAWVATVTTSGPFAALQLTGRVPGAVVCRAGDVVASYAAGVLAGTARAVRTVVAGVDGVAVIALHSSLAAGVVRIGAAETGVYEAVSIPAVPQPLRGDWVLPWQFREVLAEEIPAGATEVDPWA